MTGEIHAAEDGPVALSGTLEPPYDPPAATTPCWPGTPLHAVPTGTPPWRKSVPPAGQSESPLSRATAVTDCPGSPFSPGAPSMPGVPCNPCSPAGPPGPIGPSTHAVNDNATSKMAVRRESQRIMCPPVGETQPRGDNRRLQLQQ